MSQPPAYDRAYSFQSYQALNPTIPLPADQIDLEYNRIKATLDAFLANIALIQGDDGRLANGSVGRDQLSVDVEIGFNVPTRWVTSTAYTTEDTVFNVTSFYRCALAHTSGVFATDLAADKWDLIADFTSLTQNASLIAFSNVVSGLTATTAQAALDELASEKLDKTGGTMSGSIAMGGSRITGLPTTAAASASDSMSRGASDLRFQPLDDDLTALAAVVTAAYGRALLALANSTALTAAIDAASATLPGIVELATDAEAIAKADTGRAVRPSNLAALGSSDTFAGLAEIAVQSEMETATDVVRYVTPGRQHFHPGHPKCWAYVKVSAGVPSLSVSHNITSITDTGLGILTITIATDFSGANWAPIVSGEDQLGPAYTIVNYASVAAGSIVLKSRQGDGTPIDPQSWSFVGFGDQA